MKFLLFTTFSLLFIKIIVCYYDDYDYEENDYRRPYRGPAYFSQKGVEVNVNRQKNSNLLANVRSRRQQRREKLQQVLSRSHRSGHRHHNLEIDINIEKAKRKEDPVYYYSNRAIEMPEQGDGDDLYARPVHRRMRRHHNYRDHYRDHINQRRRRYPNINNYGLKVGVDAQGSAKVNGNKVFSDIVDRQKEKRRQRQEELARNWEQRKNEVDSDLAIDKDDHDEGLSVRSGNQGRKKPVLYSNVKYIKDEKIDPRSNKKGKARSLLPDVVEGIEDEEKVHGAKRHIPDITEVKAKPNDIVNPNVVNPIDEKKMHPGHQNNEGKMHPGHQNNEGRMHPDQKNNPDIVEIQRRPNPHELPVAPNDESTAKRKSPKVEGSWRGYGVLSRFANNKKKWRSLFWTYDKGEEENKPSLPGPGPGPVNDNKPGTKMYSSLNEDFPRRRSRRINRRNRRGRRSRRPRRFRRRYQKPRISRRSRRRRGNIRSFSGPTLEEDNEIYQKYDDDYEANGLNELNELDGEIMNFKSNLPADFFTIHKPGDPSKADEAPVAPEQPFPPEQPIPPESPIPPQDASQQPA